MNRTRDHMWSCDCNKMYCVFIIIRFYYCIIYKTILIVVYYLVKLNQNAYLSVSKNKNKNEKLWILCARLSRFTTMEDIFFRLRTRYL